MRWESQLVLLTLAGGLPMKQWLLRHEGAAFKPLAEQSELAL